MTEFLRLTGIALCLVAVCGPIAYCESQTQKFREDTKRDCIASGGNWNASMWSPAGCQFTPHTADEPPQ